MAAFRGCPCRLVSWRSSTAGQAPECGTLTSWSGLLVLPASTACVLIRRGAGVERRGGRQGWLSTLLGPEGSAAQLLIFGWGVAGFSCGPVGCPCWVAGRGSARVLRTSQWTRASL
jgi:hypothetical protein